MTDRGRCLIIPMGLAGLVVVWLMAVVLIGWTTVGGPEVASKWGLLCSAGAAAWTVIYGLARQQRLLRDAFELGRESVTRLRR